MPRADTYDGWADLIEAAPDEDTLRLAFADWLDEKGDRDEAAAQRSAAGQIRTRIVGAWAVGPGLCHPPLDRQDRLHDGPLRGGRVRRRPRRLGR